MKKIILLTMILLLMVTLTVTAKTPPKDPLETELPCNGQPCYDPKPVETKESVEGDSFNIYMMNGGTHWPDVVGGYSMFYPGTILFSNRTKPIHACIVGRGGVFQFHDPLSNPPSVWGIEIKYVGTDGQGTFFWEAYFQPWSCINNPYGWPLTRPWCNGNFVSLPGESYIGEPGVCYATIFFSGENGGMWIPPYKSWLGVVSKSGSPPLESTPVPTPYP